MTDKERYAELKKRAESIKSRIDARNGERKVFVESLKSKGFNNLAEVDAYIQKAKIEQEKKAEIIKQKLNAFERAIIDAEKALEG